MRLEGKSLKSDFLRFIIPSIIAQWVFSLYTMVDGIFVARGVSEVALTAVNISMPFTTGLFSISILFAVGNSTIVAILLGQGEKERANEVFTQNVVLLCTLSVLITILVIVFLEPFARFLIFFLLFLRLLGRPNYQHRFVLNRVLALCISVEFLMIGIAVDPAKE